MVSDPQLYARSFADVYDSWYGNLDDSSLLVNSFHDRCTPGARIVELGSGTGRLASPLHHAGFQVIALDASHEMLLTATNGPTSVTGDMAALPIASGAVDAVLVAYNTLFNLPSAWQQRRCMRDVARVLRPGGLFAIEAFVAAIDADSPFGVSTRTHPSEPGLRLAIVTGPDPADADVIVGSHIELGTTTTCRPWRLAYQSPAELDRCAQEANLELCGRYGDWAGSEFDADGLRHVSWYERI